jgi:hypothetical protein
MAFVQNLRRMHSQALAGTLEAFLSGCNRALVRENGTVLFDLAEARYSVSGENNKCLIHFWSQERNLVRRVLEVEARADILRVTAQKLGQAKPVRLEICRERDPCSPSAKKRARAQYQRILERVLKKEFPDFVLTQLSIAMDLEHSFGPVYARGLLRRGQSAFAVLGVSAAELQSSIDASLSFGILWLDSCRSAYSGKQVVQGLKLFVPPKSSAIVRERMARLNATLARWELYELDERDDVCTQVELKDHGNIQTHLVRCPDNEQILRRFGGPVALVRSLMPEAEIAMLSPVEIAFRRYGLEFARSRLSSEPGNFNGAPELLFGIGAREHKLDDSNLPDFEGLVRAIGESRHAEGPHDSRWWRLHPERWLESLVVKNVAALDNSFDSRWLYSQVPAFCAADRAMIDVLTVTRKGRLAVLELKADEDIRLPMQGIDYWARVAWHHQRGEFQKFGYFAGCELSPEPPLLIMVAPALHIHPATDMLLRYVDPSIPWELLGIDERWRNELRVVFRKRAEQMQLGRAG